MGARGPAPTPTEQLKARGSWRAKEREAAGEPTLPLKVPPCPAFLGKEGKAEWRRQAKLLLAMRVISDADRAALAVWCQAWEEFVVATGRLESPDAYTYTTDKGYEGQSPWVAIKKGAAETLLRVAQQFGFTPSARARIQAPVAPEPAAPEGKGRFFVPPPCGN